MKILMYINWYKKNKYTFSDRRYATKAKQT